MSKRKDLESAVPYIHTITAHGDLASLLWELGRIHGLREAARMAAQRPTYLSGGAKKLATIAVLRAHARKLRRRIGK